jgi:ATP-dependent DNA ligase
VGQGGEFLEHLLREGGEGVVAKPLAGTFGAGWLKCKRVQTFRVVVAGIDPMRGSVKLCDAATGEDRGKLALRSRFDHVRVGSVLKVEAFGLTARGMLREARLDSDFPGSWLVSY